MDGVPGVPAVKFYQHEFGEIHILVSTSEVTVTSGNRVGEPPFKLTYEAETGVIT